ncbi:MAG: hypothetical protein H6Q18_706 [Bacteroidetes bacterium]|nr:hypothetical protein [Bacteroidota bacterium]
MNPERHTIIVKKTVGNRLSRNKNKRNLKRQTANLNQYMGQVSEGRDEASTQTLSPSPWERVGVRSRT